MKVLQTAVLGNRGIKGEMTKKFPVIDHGQVHHNSEDVGDVAFTEKKKGVNDRTMNLASVKGKAALHERVGI